MDLVDDQKLGRERSAPQPAVPDAHDGEQRLIDRADADRRDGGKVERKVVGAGSRGSCPVTIRPRARLGYCGWGMAEEW